MNLFAWLTFAWLCIFFAEEFGLPVRVSQIARGVVLLLMLFVLLGVFGRYGERTSQTKVPGPETLQEEVRV